MTRIPWKNVHWPNSVFLIGTLVLALTAVPVYLWKFGLDPFQTILFLTFFIATGLSITLGYHRLFSHFAFKAKWPVRLFTLVFGAAAFENSALVWASDHRTHHKFVDHDDDPYDITKGFFHAHMGWILFKMKPEMPMNNVGDLEKDRLVMWQHRYYLALALLFGFGVPALLGLLWGGWAGALGAFLLAGVARVVCVQHMTFFINSLCHSIGDRPYSSRCTARDSGVMALFTFGEGYHNFHHEFQHDYRNGVKPWQFDPTKWAIWILNKTGLVENLRRVPEEKILLAELIEKQRCLIANLEQKDAPQHVSARDMLHAAHERLQEAFKNWEQLKTEYTKAAEKKIEASREAIIELERQLGEAAEHLRAAIQEWTRTHNLIRSQIFA